MKMQPHIIGLLNSTDWKLWWFIPWIVASVFISYVLTRYDEKKKKYYFSGMSFFQVTALVMGVSFMIFMIAGFIEGIICIIMSSMI